MSETAEPTLPELPVRDLDHSVGFCRDSCGFTVLYDRPTERLAYIALGSAHIALEQIGVGRNRITGDLTASVGRGIDLHINVEDTDALAKALRAARSPLSWIRR